MEPVSSSSSGFRIDGISNKDVSPISKEKLNIIETLINDSYPVNGPGCNLVIMQKDQLLASYSRGLADLKNNTPLTIQSKQHFGSVSKHFTAACVLRLSKEKNSNGEPLLNLTDNIGKYIDDLPKFMFKGKEFEITIDNLLRMRSGLSNNHTLILLEGLEDGDLTSDQKLKLITSKEEIELMNPPGEEGWKYSNTNYDLLGEIVKVVLKNANHPCKDLQEYAQEKFFIPFGMKQTGYIDQNPETDLRSQTIPGYDLDEKENFREITTKTRTWGPCGVVGTPEDMVKWNGKFDIQELSFNAAPNGWDYANGICVGNIGNFKVYSHSGQMEGFMTWYIKVDNLVDDRKSFAFFLSANNQKLEHWEFDRLVTGIMNTLADETLDPLAEEPPQPVLVSMSKEEACQLSRDCSIKGQKVTAGIIPVEVKEGQWGIKFLFNKDNPKLGFVFQPKEGSDKVFLSHQRPTAELEFTEEGVLFKDNSEGIQGVLFTTK